MFTALHVQYMSERVPFSVHMIVSFYEQCSTPFVFHLEKRGNHLHYKSHNNAKIRSFELIGGWLRRRHGSKWGQQGIATTRRHSPQVTLWTDESCHQTGQFCPLPFKPLELKMPHLLYYVVHACVPLKFASLSHRELSTTRKYLLKKLINVVSRRLFNYLLYL